MVWTILIAISRNEYFRVRMGYRSTSRKNQESKVTEADGTMKGELQIEAEPGTVELHVPRAGLGSDQCYLGPPGKAGYSHLSEDSDALDDRLDAERAALQGINAAPSSYELIANPERLWPIRQRGPSGHLITDARYGPFASC